MEILKTNIEDKSGTEQSTVETLECPTTLEDLGITKDKGFEEQRLKLAELQKSLIYSNNTLKHYKEIVETLKEEAEAYKKKFIKKG